MSFLITSVAASQLHNLFGSSGDVPHATDVRWYPNLLRALLLVGDKSPGVPKAKLRMCGVEVERLRSPGALLLDERLFLFRDCCVWLVESGPVKVFLKSRELVGLWTELISGAGPSTPGL